MFLPKSTKCGQPIFTGPMNFFGSGKSGRSGESGEGVQVLPKSFEMRKPGIGPSTGQL